MSKVRITYKVEAEITFEFCHLKGHGDPLDSAEFLMENPNYTCNMLSGKKITINPETRQLKYAEKVDTGIKGVKTTVLFDESKKDIDGNPLLYKNPDPNGTGGLISGGRHDFIIPDKKIEKQPLEDK